ncbi:molybdenum cofactor biosynthesis protein MoaE [Poritiphilus flavus]|uniref:Molybdopterin synthase catalytic subunit n=1 Tax=Poritiphilus flavus TaxID=2697053 RepID=A0A6L9E7W8_9FLAO|nr:molybdenum cofactor biosynthesis protein MoaE [Poritiphilus flavus]NAS10734.1 molybdenum cofactor biosynthesis protein MoaE [Poritiphilus flavus]
METEKTDQLFIPGAIAPDLIARSISRHQAMTGTGAQDIFLGQVRADVIDGKTVAAIEYTAYESMALTKFEEIRDKALQQYELSGVEIFHSLGEVKVGEICLFVLVSSPHRRAAFDGLHYVVEEIKAQVPVFGKERFADDSYQWKVNT